MRKIAMLAAFAAFTGAAALQAQDTPPGGRGGRGRGGFGGPGAGAMIDRALLRGITLTDAQKASLDQLHQADRERMQAQNPDERRAEMEAMRDARQRGDSATVKRLMAEQRTKMDARRDEQIASLRALLTGDQVTTFDANVAELKKREADAGPGGFGGPGGRGRRGGPPGKP